MRIFVEGSSILKNRSGVGQFAKRLVEAYVKKYPQDSVTIFGFKFFTQGDYGRPIPQGGNVSYRVIRWMPGRVYNMLFRLGMALPIDIFLARRPDVILYPNFLRWPVLNRKTKTIVIIHDLSFIYFPQYANPINLSDTTRFVPRAVKKASHIMTISLNSRKEIMDYFKVPASKISIVSPAVDTNFFYKRPASEVNKVRAKYKLPKHYILYEGTIEPRKNIEGLLAAYEQLDEGLQSKYGLVLAGGKGWQDGGITQAISRLKRKGLNIVQTGYVPDEDAPAIFSGAAIFTFPSHYEGFGIPPLEAMACGVPVISANNSSLPEVIGNAGILVDINSQTELTSAIEKLLKDEKLQKDLINRGYQQIKNFSWDKSAGQLKQALEKL
jgi:glycosyltransferase involved in cell wall biosynthesis